MIEILQDPEFNQFKSIGHAFFTRKGGVSKEHYAALNCSYMCLDKPELITENRRLAMAKLNFQLNSLVTVKNVHGNQVVVVDEPWTEQNKPNADALVTKLKNIVLASDSADCPIVLFADEQAEIIGVAHSGWQGAKKGVVENTVAQMVLLGANQQHICAVISPCITQNSYEVGPEFHQQFLSETQANTQYFEPSIKQGHFMFDLLHYVKDKLLRLKLKSVSVIGLDTYANDDLFFSYRRAFHKGEPDFGGQLSCIYQS